MGFSLALFLWTAHFLHGPHAHAPPPPARAPYHPLCAQDYMAIVGLDMVSKRKKDIQWCTKCQTPYPL